MVFVECNPYDADAKSDRGNESSYYLARYRDCHSGFIPIFIDDRDACHPLADRPPKNTGWNDEVSEKDENVNDSGLDVRNIEDAFAAAEDWSDDEDRHQQDSNVDGKGIETA